MKIVHIVRQFSPSVGGLEASVFNLARAQRRQLAFDARVVTLDTVFGQPQKLPAAAQVDGVPVVRLPWRGSSRYPLAPSVLRQVRDADLVHVHAIDFFFDYMALTRPWHRRPMIASTHGGFFHTEKSAGLKKLWFNTLTRASIQAYQRIVACSQSDAAMFRRHAGDRLTLIENGIDQEKFVNAAAGAQTRTIICFGRFARHKRIAALFPILAALRAQHPDWRLIIAGRDAEQSEAELLTLAFVAGVAGAVKLITGPTDAELRALIGEASYFACLSSYEGFGLAAVEAMSAGLTPILSEIPPFRRLVNESGIGLIVDAEAPARVAAELEASVLTDQPSYTGRRVRTIQAARRYDWEDVAAKYADVYEEALQMEDGPLVPASFGSGD